MLLSEFIAGTNIGKEEEKIDLFPIMECVYMETVLSKNQIYAIADIVTTLTQKEYGLMPKKDMKRILQGIVNQIINTY